MGDRTVWSDELILQHSRFYLFDLRDLSKCKIWRAVSRAERWLFFLMCIGDNKQQLAEILRLCENYPFPLKRTCGSFRRMAELSEVKSALTPPPTSPNAASQNFPPWQIRPSHSFLFYNSYRPDHPLHPSPHQLPKPPTTKTAQ